jgi:hypothetical protein
MRLVTRSKTKRNFLHHAKHANFLTIDLDTGSGSMTEASRCVRSGTRRDVFGAKRDRHALDSRNLAGVPFAAYRRLRPDATDRPVTMGVTLSPSLIAIMSAMVMRSSTSEIASRTFTIVKRTAHPFTLLQSPHGS